MLENGSVVRSIAGHDKDKFYVVVGSERGEFVYIADGKLRKQEAPKRKNVKHIRPTKTVLDLQIVNTNKQLRLALKPFNNGEAGKEEGGN